MIGLDRKAAVFRQVVGAGRLGSQSL